MQFFILEPRIASFLFFQLLRRGQGSALGNGESKKYGLVNSVFVLCETCHWCATYFDKSSPTCGNISISTFPILPNEEFNFNYNKKRGAELEFGLKKSKDRAKGK